MTIPRLKILAISFLAAAFALPAYGSVPAYGSTPNGSVPNANAAVPGTINYVEGQVQMGTQVLDANSIGTAQLQTGETLTTKNGKAEVLLTPGVFLRIGNESSVRMISPGLSETVAEVDQGHAMVEVADIYKQNDIRILEGGANIRLLKTGLYDFDLRHQQFRVFDGKARVEDAGHTITIKHGHELNLADVSSMQARKFKEQAYEDGDLYRWSSLRSAYLAEANVDLGDMYEANDWGLWAGAGWYWDPWFGAYTFLPGDGIFCSPFGWGFYSPWLVFDAPIFFGYGHGGGHHHHHFSADYHAWGGRSPYLEGHNYDHGIYHGPGSRGGGFHSGRIAGARGEGFAGGGFRGGGEGFHGGGEGGFHGGGFGGEGGGGFHGGGGFGGGGFGGGGFGGGHR